MPLKKLQFRPGVNRESTTLANEGGWYDCDKIRFRSGYPEKLGGWARDTGTAQATLEPPTGSYWGVCRSMWNWNTLTGNNLLGLGTNLKFYIQNGPNGFFYDVTPIRETAAGVTNAFTVYSGSTTVTVTDPGHGAVTGDFVTVTYAGGAIGGMPASAINGEHQITYLNSNQYNFTASSSATSNAGPTGTADFAYQINSGLATYTVATGWGAGSWGGTVTGSATTTLNGTINSSATTITLTSAASFAASGAIVIDSEYITYSGKSTNDLTGCVRGASGTTAAAHTSGAVVTQVTTSGSNAWNGWGVAAAGTGVGQQLRLWSQSNYGEDLIFNPRGGALYYWAVNSNPNIFDRGTIIKAGDAVPNSSPTLYYDATTPSVANLVLVSDSSRFVICFGTNDPTGVYATTAQDPLQIRWSQQEEFYTWTPAVTNQAGDYRLSRGSEIIAAQQTRQEILVWTDAAVYSMQYLGPPYVWGFQIMGDNISIAGPNVVSVANNITYWMGADKFYMYSGRVETLPCALRQYVYDDINMLQSYQFFSGTNEGYNEIWWFYCSISGPDGTGTVANPNELVDRYVVFNYLEQTWYYGNMERTFWLDSPLREQPMATFITDVQTVNAGALLYHETGNDDGTTNPASPIEAYVQSSDFDIDDGHDFSLVTRIIPDVTFNGSDVNQPTVTFTVRPRQNPGSNYGPSNDPDVVSKDNYVGQRTYNVQQFTQYVYVRVRGRQMAFRIGSSDLGVAWQLGAPRIDLRKDGRR
jgi:hypothetical protein